MRAAVLSVLLAGSAVAQPSEHAHWLRLAEQNQRGLLRYCAAQGHIAAPAPVDPGTAEPDVLAAAQAGQAGMIRYIDPQATLAESAAASGTTVAYRCQLMAQAR